MESPLEPMVFNRHKHHLHALLIDRQAWFCARDLGRMMGLFLEERFTRKLAPDQRRNVLMSYYGQAKETLMVSESAVYALLVYHPNPANLPLRKWLTYSVLPRLRYGSDVKDQSSPTPGVLEWQTGELNVMHWQDEPWIRLRDMPCLLPRRDEGGGGRPGRKWGAIKQHLFG
ncbi:Bro-N domain-containing protein [Pseudomonas syringae group sp. J309-1]|uniref:BRO-N domain-containing protein n=1 Tax=Pseudomonas syringae group sp. J309-1 TaxID=3079588 RepID=UPI002908A1C5|nr:Bro-N domain-containing protein [Pseudomonas syringae group sp. J309-1]MDU8360623.1 Bro-N domain-containing protein [Pseudomonas syringae group sp. J309-1]